MQTLSVFSVAAVTVALSTVALAHVSIGPKQSQANASQTYTIRVPAEGTVPTTMLHLEVPPAKSDVIFRYDEVVWNPPLPPGTFTQPNPPGLPPVFVKCD